MSNGVTHFEFSDGYGFHTTVKPDLESALEYANREAKGRHHMDIYETEWIVESVREYPDVTFIGYRQRLKFLKRIMG